MESFGFAIKHDGASRTKFKVDLVTRDDCENNGQEKSKKVEQPFSSIYQNAVVFTYFTDEEHPKPQNQGKNGEEFSTTHST